MNEYNSSSKQTSADQGLHNLDDVALVKLCKQQLPANLEAYKVLFDRYQFFVLNTCKSVLKSVSDAEEVSQDVMLQVLNKIHLFQERSSFKTWLYRVTRNYCNNHLSKMIRHREGREVYKVHLESTDTELVGENWGIETTLLVRETIEVLSASERLVLTLKFLKGYTSKEVAEALGIGLSAAKMRLYRALEAFEKVYRKKMDCPIISAVA